MSSVKPETFPIRRPGAKAYLPEESAATRYRLAEIDICVHVFAIRASAALATTSVRSVTPLLRATI